MGYQELLINSVLSFLLIVGGIVTLTTYTTVVKILTMAVVVFLGTTVILSLVGYYLSKFV